MGDTWVVQGAHDDAGAWVEAAEAGEEGKGRVDLGRRLKDGPSPCACGLHPPVAAGGDGQVGGFPLWRIREMNDELRGTAYQQALASVLPAAKGTALDISDGAALAQSVLLLLEKDAAAGGGPIVSLEVRWFGECVGWHVCTRSIISYRFPATRKQEHPWHAAVIRGKTHGVDVWAGAGQGEGWDEGKWGGQVALLMGDGFYHRCVAALFGDGIAGSGPLSYQCYVYTHHSPRQHRPQPPRLELAQLLDPAHEPGAHRQPRRRGDALPGTLQRSWGVWGKECRGYERPIPIYHHTHRPASWPHWWKSPRSTACTPRAARPSPTWGDGTTGPSAGRCKKPRRARSATRTGARVG